MVGLRTTDENTRSPIDGTELVRLATSGANWKATLANIFASLARTTLEADTSYYVSTTGNDANDGSSGNPWLTLQHATDYLRNKIDFGGFRVDLIIQTAGTYVGFVNGGGYVGGGILSIHGATNAPNSYVVTDPSVSAAACFRFIYDTSTQIRFDQLTFKPITSFNDCVWLDCHAFVTVAGSFGDGLGQAVTMDFSSDVTNANGWIVSGGGKLAVFGTIGVTVPATKNIFTFYGAFGQDDNNSGASFQTTFVTYNFSNNLRIGKWVFADTFSMHVNGHDTINFLAGSVISGQRYFAETGAIINTFGAAETFFPGVTNGNLSTGGQYI